MLQRLSDSELQPRPEKMKPPRTGKLIPYAKLSDEQARRIVQGFAFAETVAEIAAATGLSQKTCRTTLLALRPRLLGMAFRYWRDAAHRRWGLDPSAHEIAELMVFGVYAKCYFNRRCYARFREGRRASRVCGSCSIHGISEPDDDLKADLYLIDLIHNHYAHLGLGNESGNGKLTQFRLRLLHTQIVGEAFEATRKRRDGTPDFGDRREGTMRHLFERMVRDLEREPLRRNETMSLPDMADLEDLSWVKGPGKG